MLQTQTVVPELMVLLIMLNKTQSFSNFYLVGGTALSLQIDHRNSIIVCYFKRQKTKKNNKLK